ncbi:hypothetical protein [Thalassovita taeanensis]|uniref:Uncharacterized protein n=1 Tax=Thalassovita taeanensis TaxID=657014 RepID=A0A1H9DJM2_9RHOB|nr:hypothetical protein [Thalassovita taeanensis]SEQ12953.1 hypothetical protein SAMN04488092_104158 [Thalassovita taeanensis]
MPSAAAVVEGIQAILTLESVVSSQLDTFRHAIEIEVLNGDVDANGHILYNGFKDVHTCYNEIVSSDYDYWIVDKAANPPLDLHPPESTIKMPEGDGFLCGLQSNAGRGVYCAFPVQTSAVWFEMSSQAVRDKTVWKDLAIPAGVAAKGFKYPGRYFPTFIFGVYNSYGGDHYMAPLSVIMSPEVYHPNKKTAVGTWSSGIYKALYENGALFGIKGEETSEIVMDFDTPLFDIAGMNMSGNTPRILGYSGYEQGGKHYFLSDAGDLCMPYAKLTSSAVGGGTKVMNISLSLRRDYTQPKQ